MSTTTRPNVNEVLLGHVERITGTKHHFACAHGHCTTAHRSAEAAERCKLGVRSRHAGLIVAVRDTEPGQYDTITVAQPWAPHVAWNSLVGQRTI